MKTEKLREEFDKSELITTEIYRKRIFDFFLPHLKSEAVEVSDDEIEKQVDKIDTVWVGIGKHNFIRGAKWMRDKQGIAPCKAVEIILKKAEELAKEYESILRKYNYLLRLKGDDVMDFQTLSEFKELFNQFIKEEGRRNNNIT